MTKKKATKKSELSIDIMPEHESAVRRLVAENSGRVYNPLKSLQQAKLWHDGTVILEGDDGGQIYVVSPASLVQCTVEVLEQLLRDLDYLSWPGNPPDMAQICYERLSIGSHVASGMGGATVLQSIWVHEEFRRRGLEAQIRGVIEGRYQRIQVS